MRTHEQRVEAREGKCKKDECAEKSTSEVIARVLCAWRLRGSGPVGAGQQTRPGFPWNAPPPPTPSVIRMSCARAAQNHLRWVTEVRRYRTKQSCCYLFIVTSTITPNCKMCERKLREDWQEAEIEMVQSVAE